MSKFGKRFVSFIMAMIMIISLFPLSAFASDDETNDNTSSIVSDEQSTTAETVKVNNAQSLQAAIEAAPTDGTETTIELSADIDGGTLTPSNDVLTIATIPAGKNIVLDLAGHTISANLNTNGSTYGNAQVIRNEGTLTIKDSSSDQSGEITGSSSYGCTATVRNQAGQLTIESGTITSVGGNAIRNQNGSITINGGTFTTTGQFASFDNGTAAIHNRGNMVINGGEFSTEYQAPMWYGAGTENSTTVINGGTFTSTHSGVDIQGSDGSVSVTGGQFHVDPSDYIAPGYFVKEEGSYYVVSLGNTIETVTSFSALKQALATTDTANITISGNVIVNENITVPENVWLSIAPGATLTIDNADLVLNGYLINQGTLDVSKIGNGFVDNLIRYIDDNGTISGLPAERNGVYEISTAAQLQMMHFVLLNNADSNSVFNGNISLTQDIDLTGHNFLPLGYDCAVAFKGTFDGQGHTIKNLTINLAAGDIGLFSVTEDANFQNFSITDASLTTQSGLMGTLAGEIYGSSNFSNISISGEYTNAASYYCGGWIGYMGGDEGSAHNFINCHNAMNVTGCYNVGSFWGSSSGSKAYVTMINCSNSGNVTATGGTIGIIGGYAYNDGILYNFTNTGTITNNNTVVDNPNYFNGKNPANNDLDGIVAVKFGSGTRATLHNTLEDALNTAVTGEGIDIITDTSINSSVTIDEDITVTGFDKLTVGEGASLSISAGTYDSDPTDYLAEGLKAKKIGNTYKVIDKDIYTITFDANGGSCDTATADTNGDGVLTALPTPTLSGYTFDGWFTAADGGEQVKEGHVFSADTTLYAHWTKISSGGGSTVTPAPTPEPEEPSDSEETVTNPDGSTTTTITKEDGSSSTTTVGTDGTVESEVTVSKDAVDNADGSAVTLPMPEVPVTTDKTTAPTVTVNLPSKDATKVEVPVKDVTAGTVAVLVDADGNETVIKDTVQSENGITVEVTDGATIKVVDNSKTFDDVADNYWGADAIDFATSRELFAGTAENTFSPEGDMTRAMIWSVLARYEGADTPGGTGDTWYAGPQQWAMENGISDGTMANSAMTREQFAAMLYRYVGSPAVSGTVGDYSDADSVSSWASDAMVWAVQQGLIAGMDDGTLNPQGTATRTQVAAILQRFIENKMA